MQKILATKSAIPAAAFGEIDRPRFASIRPKTNPVFGGFAAFRSRACASLKALACGAMIAALAGISTGVSAQFAKPEDAVKYRKNALFVMQQHFGRLAAMAQGKAPYDAKLAADNALIVANMAGLPWAGFVEGTDKGDTKAKPEIWKDKENFRQLSEKFVVEVGKLKTASATGKLDDLKAAVNATAGACKACHDEYRAK